MQNIIHLLMLNLLVRKLMFHVEGDASKEKANRDDLRAGNIFLLSMIKYCPKYIEWINHDYMRSH
jgi:hypothetical protein